MKTLRIGIILSLTIIGVVAVLCLIGVIFNPRGFWAFWGDVHDGSAHALSAAGIGITLVFFITLGLGVIYAVLYLRREHDIVRPGKYGAAQAVKKFGGELVLVPQVGVNTDPQQQIAMAKEVMQLAVAMVRASKQIDQFYSVVEPKEELTAPVQQMIESPRYALRLSDSYQLPADDALSGRKLFVGVSGSGKSNGVGVYVEELGRLDVPLLLGDTMDEYQPLCNPRWLPHGVLANATGGNGSYQITVENAYQFGQYLLVKNLQVILNLNSYDPVEAANVIIQLIGGMRDWQMDRENEQRIPCDFVLEEAVQWLPQYIKESPLYKAAPDVLAELQGTIFNDMVRQGRKNGLGLTLVCQKIAELDNRAMQSDVKMLLRQSEEADLERYRKFGITREETLSLANGEAFLFTPKVSKFRLQVRRRYSPHGGNTPGLENLQRYQQMRTPVELDFEPWRTSEPSNLVRPQFGARSEPVRDSSGNGPGHSKSDQREIPLELRTEIARLYRGGMGRKKIQEQLRIAGDQFWQLRDICDAVDHEQKVKEV